MAEVVDEKFMQRALDLAVRAEGMTYPNPVVGAVIVHEGLIIGEGYHIRSGEPHAEVHAIKSVKRKELLQKSTLYVTLEPCSHFGKTPPCTDLIIGSEIPRIVIGTKDTSSRVSGKGIEKLRAAGKEVTVGMLENECRWINRRFFTFHEKKRPYIILKWAQSSDGYIDTPRPAGSHSGPFWISGKPERVLVHKWRSQEQTIMAGAGTIRTDNPALNVRYWSGNNPLKLILSGSGNIGKYLTENETNDTVITFTYNINTDLGKARKILLEKETPASKQIADYLYKNEIQSLFIEGGALVLEHFITTDLWDEARIFTGVKVFKEGVKAPAIGGKKISSFNFATSIMDILINQMDQKRF